MGYTVKKKTMEGMLETLKQLEETKELMDMEEEVEKRQKELRERHLAKLEEDVTLDDILTDSEKNSLCHFLSVFKNR